MTVPACPPDRLRDAIIVGGGFSGTMLAVQLAKRGKSSILVEAMGRAGLGTAFSTPEEVHLLNVPAGKMSAWPDRAGDFAETVAGEGHEPGDFVSRRRFGAYVRHLLEQAIASGQVRLVEGRAISADAGWTVALEHGEQLSAPALVLAHGNQPPEPLRSAAGIPDTLFVNDPWSDTGRAAISEIAAQGGDVLIIGTGLTMVDVVLSLDSAGHQGRIVALSRRGLVPRAHAPFDPVVVEPGEVPGGSVRALTRWLRRCGAEVGWRAAVDSLRPHSHALWRSFDAREQARFLRHARPWWDVHRHRIAPQVAGVLKRLIGEGRLEIAAGRIQRMSVQGDRLEVTFRRRGRDADSSQDFALGVNCTGPLGRLDRTGDALLRQLLAKGLARPDAIGMGLQVDEYSRVAGAQRLWALGPLTKGAFWEMVAVPDIRGQVADVADQIAGGQDR
jgi:uncharacterized NAD(P)/FAD-binding protein YdhS